MPRRAARPRGAPSLAAAIAAASRASTSAQWRSSERITARESAGEGRQREPPAARPDRRQDAPRRVADDEEERARRRLLDHLQERVGAGGVQVLGAVDDADRGSRRPRRSSRTARALRRTLSTGDRRGGFFSVVRRSRAARPGSGGTAPRPAAPPDVGGGTSAGGTSGAPGQDGRGRSARRDRRASPCRCRAGPPISQAWCRRPAAIGSRNACSAAAWPKNAASRAGEARQPSVSAPSSAARPGSCCRARRADRSRARRRRAQIVLRDVLGVRPRRSRRSAPARARRWRGRPRAAVSWNRSPSPSKRSAASRRPRAARPGRGRSRAARRGRG